MSKLRVVIMILVVAAACVLIGAQWQMGTIPPQLFYPAFAVLAGGGLFLKFQRIFQHIQGAWSQDATQGRQTLIIYIVMFLVIGVGGFFFMRS